MTVLENVMMPMYYVGSYKDSVASARWAAGTGRPARYREQVSNQISGGQQQRASHRPRAGERSAVIVGDEPTGNLDMVSAGLIFAV